jgi:hypothetical protein
MKATRTLAIALLSYAAMLAPTASQADSIEVPVPGGHVRLPAPPLLPVPVPPVVVIQGDHGHDSGYHAPEHRHYERRYYHEDHRRYHDDHHDHYDHDHYRDDHRH